MILDKIAERTYERVAMLKKKKDIYEVRREAESMRDDTGFLFEKALLKPGISCICEIKKASPSKGMIAEDFPYLQIAQEYEEAGAAAISVLTEPYFFLGSDTYLQEVVKTVSIPVLRKDFTVDPYQIYEAKLLGASAILLICALLDEERLKEYMQIAEALGLSVLTETHTKEEVETALRADARIIGINNRNLKTFHTDIAVTIDLAGMIPEDRILVSESGIRTPQDAAALKACRADGLLIGETLMRSSNKKETLSLFIK